MCIELMLNAVNLTFNRHRLFPQFS
jgi:NADH:ubiquinone oxidoreductase subunit K